ncbi:hypothetical protein MNBD_BACTEROID05-792 [hydrothermal vent metagenome]|uniref:Lipoprotein n=1 Tax=hydrothermal vent metagenome TaxID=652676 RepID=A0A3B0TDF6_9ZZZZ
MKINNVYKGVLGISFLVVLVLLAGCTKVKHLDQLMTLKGLADSHKDMAEYVDKKDQLFVLLKEKIESNELETERLKKSILKEFGEPILKRSVYDQEFIRELWLYRYQTRYFEGSKVYLYFDDQNKLLDWKIEGGLDE